QLERAPRTAKRIERSSAFGDFRSAWVTDLIFENFVRRRRIRAVIRTSRNQFPLQRFLRTIRRTIRKRINAPTFSVGLVIGVAVSERLPFAGGAADKQVACVRTAIQRKTGE